MSIKNILKKIIPVSFARMDSYYKELKKDNEKLRKQNAELQDMILDLNKVLKGMKKELRNVYTDIHKIETELQATKENTGEIKTELKTVGENTGKIRTELHEVYTEGQSVKSELQNVRLEGRNIKQELHDSYMKMSNLTKGIRSKMAENTKKLEYKMNKYMEREKIAEALRDWYYEQTGNDLDLEHPRTYNEIIQWTKMYDFDDEKCRLVDKYLVRDWVKEKIGERYLIPLIGVWDRVEDIDFEALPQSFVLKCNHGCGYNIIVKDKTEEDFDNIRKKLNDWLHEQFAFKYGFELQYARIQPRIIAEQYIENENEDLYDYKVFCFNGKAKYIMFLSNRKRGLKMQFYDLDWNLQPFVYNYERGEMQVEKPQNLSELIACAEKLAQGFIQVRVDFYQLNDGTWKFGEMTFTSASGAAKWNPAEYDRILGEMIQMPEK